MSRTSDGGGRRVAAQLGRGAAVGAVAILAVWPSGAVHAGATYISSYSFTSAAGDYIGQGATASYTAPSATFGMSGTLGDLTFSVTTSTEWWYVNIAAPIGQQLQPGTYTNAMRAPFRTGTAPGLDVYGDGRGCNNVYGQFTINAIAADSSGNITLLDATFTQNCEQPSAPPLNGTVKYQTSSVAASTTTALSASATSSAFGAPVTLTATVTPSGGAAATGTVTFLDGPAALGSAPLGNTGASLTTSNLGVGSHSITASYGGDSGDTRSTSAAMTVTIVPDGTATSLSSSAACSQRGQAVTFSVAVTDTSGGAPIQQEPITFYDGSTSIGSARLSASDTTSLTTAGLSIGSHSITAVYAGDPTHSGSTSGTVVQTVVRRHC